MRFEANKISLDIDVVTLSGEEVNLIYDGSLSGTAVKSIMAKWTTLEKNMSEEDGLDKVDLLAKELSFVYGKDAKWFMDNLDFITLQDILTYVAELLGGAVKKETSSN